MLHYQIAPKSMGAHLLSVTITVPNDQDIVQARLPKWIPGSYKIRDFSRHIQSFQAHNETEALTWHKIDSDTWEINAKGQPFTLTYDVYAYDLSVRGAYFDDQRLFFNACCVFLDIIHLSHEQRSVDIIQINDWCIFTALPFDGMNYTAENYSHLIDCPVQAAKTYVKNEFIAQGITHQVLFTGTLSEQDDFNRVSDTLEKICHAEMTLFGGTPLTRDYLFMTHIEANQYGGLEHCDSVAQMASPDMLPKKGQPESDKVIDFYGLCSHEYFHLWNVKRLKPKDFLPYDLSREQNTEMLWMFEGFTSYYDEVFLLRAGVVDAKTFLTRQAKNLTRVLNVPGRNIQSLAESSFDAWTKLYQADTNSANNMVSYYSKGAVFALYLDLWLRKHSDGKSSLDDVMRYLWQNFGIKNIGIDENDVFSACITLLPEVHYEALASVFVHGIHGTDDLPLAEILPHFGVKYQTSASHTNEKLHTSYAGMRIDVKEGAAVIGFLAADSDAANAGVSVGDEMIAIDGQQLNAIDANGVLNVGVPEQAVLLTLSRRGRVFNKTIKLVAPMANQVTLTSVDSVSLGDDWLCL